MKPLLLLPALLVAGCATERAGYPSLAPRAAERSGFAEPTIAPPPAVVADPALDAQLAAFEAKVDGVTQGFDKDAGLAGRAAAAPGARTVGGEAWLTAQTALAGLDDWRAQATGLASELEALAGERLATAGVAYPPLETLRTRAAAEAERQSAVIARIAALLPAP